MISDDESGFPLREANRNPDLRSPTKTLRRAATSGWRSTSRSAFVVFNLAELLAADPDVYYVTDHYLNYTSVLVRLSRVTHDVLRDLLGMAHKFVTGREATEARTGAEGNVPSLSSLRISTEYPLHVFCREKLRYGYSLSKESKEPIRLLLISPEGSE